MIPLTDIYTDIREQTQLRAGRASMDNIEKTDRSTVAERKEVEAPNRALAPVAAFEGACVSGVEAVKTPGLAADRVYQLAAVTAGLILLATLL